MRLNAARLIENTGGRDVDRSAENEWRRKPTKQRSYVRCILNPLGPNGTVRPDNYSSKIVALSNKNLSDRQ
ncbi:uncharacterized protein LOC105197173 isoform X2 [Solenopsis invicta]|uniref:uncharacterized protein LOC105197173 isoform X2 n=1 Tax=Solenopsis invicta TaxID=13686 RepID=UPI00193D2E35|nr:uncharacterized protein LOC105197173 isoform X2 [Solenopsis invicta]